MTKFFSDRDTMIICKPLEVRGFVVEFDDEKQIMTASKNGTSIKTKYSFYRSAFGRPALASGKD